MFAWLNRLDQHVPVRYSAWFLCAMGFLISAFCWVAFDVGWLPALVFLLLVGLGLRDTMQTQRSVLRNYPVIGHLRYLLEFIRPEIRQYFIEGDNDAAPFSRQQRSLVYQRAKGDSDKRPFGTQLDVGASGYEWINHSLAPTTIDSHDFRVLIGANRAQPYSASVFNISAMSFGALSANAILALNAGARAGNFAHDTGEGSISQHHRVHGGDLIWEIGSGYFGCRNDDGSFNAEKFSSNARDPQVKMIELKLSQGAKPGHGGVLPGPKVTPEIAQARGVAVGQDCVSSSGCVTCRAANRRASNSASATLGSGSRSRRRWWKRASRPTSSLSTVPRAAPERRRSSSPITSARRCRKACCWCTTRSSA
jgi:glutamate synthase domain-containing protein 2